MPGPWSLLFSICLSVQESFFTPFAARGRGSQWKGGESNFPKTPKIPRPHLKQPVWLSTQDRPQDQKRRDKTGANRDCPQCLPGSLRTHTLECAGISCVLMSVHQASVYKPLSPGAGSFVVETTGSSVSLFFWTCGWRGQPVHFYATLGRRVSFFPGPAWK